MSFQMLLETDSERMFPRSEFYAEVLRILCSGNCCDIRSVRGDVDDQPDAEHAAVDAGSRRHGQRAPVAPGGSVCRLVHVRVRSPAVGVALPLSVRPRRA